MNADNSSRRIVVVLGALLLLYSSGCDHGRFRSTESRLNYSLEFVERDVQNPSPLRWVRDEAACMLRQLRAATVVSLREPTACCAHICDGSNGPTIAVYWIEHRPTPDGVRFQLGPNSTPIDAAFWGPYADENKKAAKRGVLFVGGPAFPADSEDVAALWKAEEVTVMLMKNGRPVSNAVPLHRVRADEGPILGTRGGETGDGINSGHRTD